MTGRQLTDTIEGSPRAAGIVKRHWMVVAALLGAVVIQVAFVASFTGAEARPVLHHVTIGLAGPSSAPAGHAGSLPGSTISYQRFPTPQRHARRSTTGAGPLLWS